VTSAGPEHPVHDPDFGSSSCWFTTFGSHLLLEIVHLLADKSELYLLSASVF
jgi:hypothetical protein